MLAPNLLHQLDTLSSLFTEFYVHHDRLLDLEIDIHGRTIDAVACLLRLFSTAHRVGVATRGSGGGLDPIRDHGGGML